MLVEHSAAISGSPHVALKQNNNLMATSQTTKQKWFRLAKKINFK